MTELSSELTVLDKLYAETARISWRELQRFFAQGSVLQIDADLDLVGTAVLFAEDCTDELEPLLVEHKINTPGNDQARIWFDNDAVLWSVVVAPFVLVQEQMWVNAVVELIRSHHSIRRFTDRTISPDLLRQLVCAGQAASSFSCIQAVSIVRVTKPGIREQFVTLSGGQKYIATAAEFLVFCADLNRNQHWIESVGNGSVDFAWTEQFLAATVNVALVAQNWVIAAESVGLGCCYIGGIRNDPDKVVSLLQLPALVYPVFGLCLGYPDQQPLPKLRLPENVVLHENEYRSADQMVGLLDDHDLHVQAYYRHRTAGKVDHSWSQQMTSQAATQIRPFIKGLLNKQGFIKKQVL